MNNIIRKMGENRGRVMYHRWKMSGLRLLGMVVNEVQDSLEAKDRSS
jgi:hypothetical protein